MPLGNEKSFEQERKNFSADELLPPADRELIKAGLEKLAAELKDMPVGSLPHVVIYAETSARPLAYAVSPVLNKVYSKKGLTKPAGFYFQAFAGFPFELDQSRRNRFKGIDYQDQAYREEEETFRGLYKDEPQKFEEYMEMQKRVMEEVNRKRELMRKRAKEIIEYLGNKPDLRVLLIEDYSKIHRTTITEVFRAFEHHNPNVKMTAFAFLSGISYEDPEYYSQEELDELYPAAGSKNLKIIIGTIDPKTDRSGLRYPAGPAYSSGGFKYRSPDDPVFGGGERAERAIGFIKNEQSTKTALSPKRNPEGMALLQKGLAEIGNKVAENIS